MAEIPIEIRIKAIVEGAPEVADLVNSLEKLKNLSGDLGQALAQSGEEGRRATEAMSSGIRDLSPAAIEAARDLNKIRDVGVQKDLIDAAKSADSLSEFLRTAGIEAKYFGEEISKTQERLISVAQASGVYFKGLENVSIAMKDQNVLMSFRKQLLGSLIVSDQNKAAATQYLTRELHGNAQAASGLVNAYTSLQGAGFTLRSVVLAIANSLEIANQSGLSHEVIMNKLRPAYGELLRSAGMTKNEITAFSVALANNTAEGQKSLIQLYKKKKALGEVTQMYQEYKAQLGAAGMALKDFSRDIFWTGLGVMFTTMSVARSIRMYAQLEDISYNLAQASISVKEAEDAYREALMLEGPASEEAISARRRLVEAQYREEQARRQGADAIRQYNLSLGMLIFGMMPTAMRTAHTFGDLFTRLGIIQGWSGDQAVGAGAKQLVLAGAQNKAAVSSVVQGVATGTTATIVSLAGDAGITTAGKMHALAFAEEKATIGAITLRAALGDVIGLAIFAASVMGVYAYSNWQAEESMKAYTRESEKWKDELGYGADSLDNLIGGSGLIEATQRTKEFTSTLREIPRIEEITVDFGVVREPEEITQVVRQEIIGEKLEERRRKLVLTGMDNMIIRNMETSSFEGRDLHMGMGITKWYKVGDLTAENVSGAFGPSAIEIELLRVIAKQSILLGWLPHIWFKTGNLLQNLWIATTTMGTDIEAGILADQKAVEGIGQSLGIDIAGVGTNVSSMDTNVTDKIGKQTSVLASPLGELSSISDDTADFVTNLQTIIDLTKGTVALLAGIAKALSLGTDLFGAIQNTIAWGLDLVVGATQEVVNTMGGRSVHVDIQNLPTLPDVPSQVINININNPIVRSEADIESLAREVRYRIARGVKVR